MKNPNSHLCDSAPVLSPGILQMHLMIMQLGLRFNQIRGIRIVYADYFITQIERQRGEGFFSRTPGVKDCSWSVS